MNELLLSDDLLPIGFKYPGSYINTQYSHVLDEEPWGYFHQMLQHRFYWINKRYPERTLVPFARRYDNDDVACFDGTDTSGDPRVIIIHDWASPGWENRVEFNNFLEWLECAREEAEIWRSMSG